MKIEFEKCKIDGIPTLSCFKDDGLQKPLIILSHALRDLKEYWQAKLEALAAAGYYAVALDNRGHGERKEKDSGARVFIDRKVNVYEVRRLIKETADDVPILINHFAAKKQVDAARIGMVGVSMGGFATFRALVIEKRIKVAAPILASPHFDEMPSDVPTSKRPEIQQALEAYSREYSPAHDLGRFFPRAVLIQIGGQDKHFNGQRVAQFYRELTSYYQEMPEKLAFIVDENAAHEFTASMWDNVTDWFQKHL